MQTNISGLDALSAVNALDVELNAFAKRPQRSARGQGRRAKKHSEDASSADSVASDPSTSSSSSASSASPRARRKKPDTAARSKRLEKERRAKKRGREAAASHRLDKDLASVHGVPVTTVAAEDGPETGATVVMVKGERGPTTARIARKRARKLAYKQRVAAVLAATRKVVVVRGRGGAPRLAVVSGGRAQVPIGNLIVDANARGDVVAGEASEEAAEETKADTVEEVGGRRPIEPRAMDKLVKYRLPSVVSRTRYANLLRSIRDIRASTPAAWISLDKTSGVVSVCVPLSTPEKEATDVEEVTTAVAAVSSSEVICSVCAAKVHMDALSNRERRSAYPRCRACVAAGRPKPE